MCRWNPKLSANLLDFNYRLIQFLLLRNLILYAVIQWHFQNWIGLVKQNLFLIKQIFLMQEKIMFQSVIIACISAHLESMA